MPFWLSFLGTRFLHFSVYAIIGLAVWAGYQKIVQPTNVTTTTVADGGKQVNVYEQPKQTLMSFGCTNLVIEAYWKKPIHQLRKKGD